MLGSAGRKLGKIFMDSRNNRQSCATWETCVHSGLPEIEEVLNGCGLSFPTASAHSSICSAPGSLECWVERVGMGELDFGLSCQLKPPDFFPSWHRGLNTGLTHPRQVLLEFLP